jgi:hypothetical protein
MPRTNVVLLASLQTVATLLAVAATAAHATTPPAIRKPLGVYAKVDIPYAINGYPGPGTPTPDELHTYLRGVYANLLADPAIAGLTIDERWDRMETTPGPHGYDWSFLDDAFATAGAVGKTVQLILTPGVDMPQWLRAKIPSCDSLFHGGAAPDCGTVTFVKFPEVERADSSILPLPWNAVYQQAWASFLTHVNARYGPNPAFVAIAIAGPIAASDEMILPTSANTTAKQPSGLSVDDTWAALIKHSFPSLHSYQHSDQAFIDAWKKTIDAYETAFSGVTLFLGPDAGNDLPAFEPTVTPHPDNTLFARDCKNATKNLMSCEAKTEVLSYFVKVAGPNGKATQVGGMTASSPKTPGNIGVAGVKVLTSLSPAPSPAFLGGAEFDLAVSGADLQQEGCPNYPAKCKGLTIEEAAFNVLTVFFYGTPVASSYDGTNGSAPITYLDVPYLDVQYAQEHDCPEMPSPTLGNTSLQDLYNQARRDLLKMAKQSVTLPPATCN